MEQRKNKMACNLHIEDFIAIQSLVVNGRCSDPMCKHRGGLIGAHPRNSVGMYTKLKLTVFRLSISEYFFEIL